MRQMLLDKVRTFKSNNKEGKVHFGLTNDSRLLPVSDVDITIDQYEQYCKEKDESNKFRVIATIVPYCSNVLFNAVTEVVKNEGSDKCVVVGSKGISGSKPTGLTAYTAYASGKTLDTRKKFIQDTAPSHPNTGGFEYHCGADIFNNHWLRKDGFVVINKLNNENGKSSKPENFNTIFDILRDSDGNDVKETINRMVSSGGGYKFQHIDSTPIHVYMKDAISSFSKTLRSKLIEKDGWFGFENVGGLEVDNTSIDGGKTFFTINKCLNDRPIGDFVDMYPDRSLYTFTPKINKHRKNRPEYNWECFLTYPYDTDMMNALIYDCDNDISGLECQIVNKAVNIELVEKTQYLFRTKIMHPFTKDTQIRINELNDKGEIINTYDTTVSSTGKNGEGMSYYFSVLGSTIYNSISSNSGLKDKRFRVCRISNGVPCIYYFRKFRRIPELKGRGIDTSNTLGDDIINELITSGYSGNFSKVVSKVGFDRNAYDDGAAQIVFGDDVDVSGLVDHLGRPLTEIYLTVVKTNKGHNEWYTGNHTGETIEFSRCFGSISSGIEIPWCGDDAWDDFVNDNFNVHRIHNAEQDESIGVDESPDHIERDIDPDNLSFYGDIVEFSPYDVSETVLMPVCHRFNTVQRELTSDEYSDIFYDDIYTDEHEFMCNDSNKTGITDMFQVKPMLYNGIYGFGKFEPESTYKGNIFPEGYFYQAHYRIPLREFSDDIERAADIIVKFSQPLALSSGKNIYSGITDTNYYLQPGDMIYLRGGDGAVINGEITFVKGRNYDEIGVLIRKNINSGVLDTYTFFKKNPAIPEGAYCIDATTGEHAWRNIKKTAQISSDSELYDTIFMNGANYRYLNTNFYLKRQDPYGMYGLSRNRKKPVHVLNLTPNGNYFDISPYEYVEHKNSTAQC